MMNESYLPISIPPPDDPAAESPCRVIGHRAIEPGPEGRAAVARIIAIVARRRWEAPATPTTSCWDSCTGSAWSTGGSQGCEVLAGSLLGGLDVWVRGLGSGLSEGLDPGWAVGGFAEEGVDGWLNTGVEVNWEISVSVANAEISCSSWIADHRSTRVSWVAAGVKGWDASGISSWDGETPWDASWEPSRESSSWEESSVSWPRPTRTDRNGPSHWACLIVLTDNCS